MAKPKIMHLFIFVALLAVLVLPCFTMFVVIPLYKGFIVSEAEKIVTNVTQRMAHYLVGTEEIDNKNLPIDFIREVAETKKLLGSWKIIVYRQDGTIAHSSETSEIGTKATESFFPEIIRTGKAHTQINKREIVTIDGVKKELDLVESYVPIVVNGRQVGVFGLFHNLSKNRNTLSILRVFEIRSP